MKTFAKIILVILAFAVTSSSAQSLKSKQYLELAQKSYLTALESKNHGVRNSTIFMVVQFKKKHPDENFRPFIKKLQKISREDPEMKNRLHAYLALVCLQNPELIASINPHNYEDSKIFFDSVYDVLADIQLALK